MSCCRSPQKCGTTFGVASKPFWLRAQDGVRLYAVEAGRGNVGVVLAHESPADLCGWLPYMATLEHAGVRVLAFDFRGFGDSDRPASTRDFLAYGRDFRAAVAHLESDGAKKVFLMGASFGGAAALTYAPGLRLAGVVSFSGETHLPGTGLNGLAAVPRLRAPLLIVGSRHDRYLSVADALRLLRRAGSHDKRTALYPGGYHGWDLVEDAPYAAKVRALVLAWVRAH
ncbi:MAG TPA: alpha/beta fold hydrolase [Gaiellaceae bacterium]|nr:alpha/beta fold hydrolase [Gaiellaceae bacterium]